MFRSLALLIKMHSANNRDRNDMPRRLFFYSTQVTYFLVLTIFFQNFKEIWYQDIAIQTVAMSSQPLFFKKTTERILVASNHFLFFNLEEQH